MLNSLKNFARANKSARTITDLEHRLTMIVSHATGGLTDDWRRSINDVCVDISRHSNRVYAAGKEVAAENPLTGMGTLERAVLDHLSGDIGVRFTTIAADTGFKRADVQTVVRMFALKGLAHLAPLFDEETGTLGGRGYVLTGAGLAAQRELRREARPTPPWATGFGGTDASTSGAAVTA